MRAKEAAIKEAFEQNAVTEEISAILPMSQDYAYR